MSRTPAAAAPLEVTDDPCWVLLSTTGMLARTADATRPGISGARVTHDAIASAVPATARGEVAVVTTRGRAVRLSVLEIPTIPGTDAAPSLSGGSPVAAHVALADGEEALALVTIDPAAAGRAGVALATAHGVVKRVAPEAPPARATDWPVITLKDGDQVVGAVDLPADDVELVLVASDGQLLHFPASAVRPQGRSAGGVAGIKLGPGARVAAFAAVSPAEENVAVTIAGSRDALPGTEAGSIKVTPFSEYPGKGRATGGVRAHRFRAGEDVLRLAWVGPAHARAATSAGAAVRLPEATGKRDGSGEPAAGIIAAIGALPPAPVTD